MKLPRFQITGSSVVNVIGVMVILYLLVVLGETIQRNYTLGHQIDTLKAQIALLQDQKDSLAYDIQYYKTDSFRDRQARSQLGLQLPGENVVIIPGAGASDQTVPEDGPKKAVQPKSNFQKWLDFFTGRSS